MFVCSFLLNLNLYYLNVVILFILYQQNLKYDTKMSHFTLLKRLNAHNGASATLYFGYYIY